MLESTGRTTSQAQLTAGGFYGCQNFIRVLEDIKVVHERKSAKEN